MKKAMLYKTIADNKVRCLLCAHLCLIRNGKKGVCLVRKNHDGTLFTQAYGKSIVSGVDPIEKKPLFIFYPGSHTFSIATAGCNFNCSFCQNWRISQVLRDGSNIRGQEFSPHEIVNLARETNCQSIAYTCTEPTIFFEYAYDTAKLAQNEGLKNIFVTNGYMTAEALKTIRPYLDAANVDLKSIDNDFYKKWAGAKLQPVLDTLTLMKKLGIWLEVTTLIIPTLNDSEGNLHRIASFIARELGVSTPWHISRLFPTFDVTEIPNTPVESLHTAREIGLKTGLRYIYQSNIPDNETANTYCYNCGALLIRRNNYHIDKNNITAGYCRNCGTEVDGIGMYEHGLKNYTGRIPACQS